MAQYHKQHHLVHHRVLGDLDHLSAVQMPQVRSRPWVLDPVLAMLILLVSMHPADIGQAVHGYHRINRPKQPWFHVPNHPEWRRPAISIPYRVSLPSSLNQERSKDLCRNERQMLIDKTVYCLCRFLTPEGTFPA